MIVAYPTALAPHFTELAGQWKAIPDTYQTNARAMLALLERARALGGGQPMRVTSWYRNAARNKAVGGSSNSQHLTASAVDFSVADPARWVQTFAASADPASYGQLMFYKATTGHVHLALPNRSSGKVGEYLIETAPGKWTASARPVNTLAGNGVSSPVDGSEGEASAVWKWAIYAALALVAAYLIGVIT